MASEDVRKLQFSELHLHGRSKELDFLQDVFNLISDPARSFSSFQIVTILGCSGTGKSALVHEFVKQMRSRSTSGASYFICGKFDQYSASEPYSALAVAFTELDIILSSDESDEMGDAIKKAVGSEARLLTNVVPRLSVIFGKRTDGGENVGNSDPLNRLKFAFRVLLRTICTPSHPIILFVDDLQWADSESVDLIKAIVSDSKLANFLFIGTFRENEMGKGHPVALQLRDINKQKNINKIHLGNLHVQTVNELICTLTRLDASETQQLCNIVYRRTHGNVFFVIHFLRMLEEKGFLFYSIATFRWTWDIDLIESETTPSDNVVSLVVEKIRRVSEQVQTLLKVAACLWSTIDVDVLGVIMAGLAVETCPGNTITNTNEVVRLLDEAAVHSLVDRKGTGARRYRFAHDRIQQGAYSLIPEGKERDLLHLRIGELILQMSSSSQTEEWMLLTATDQLNRGSFRITDGDKRTRLSRLNLQAGKMASALSAFVPASNYLTSGIDLLDEDNKWGTQYELSLELHNAAAEVAICSGDLQRSKAIVDEVLANARCLRDKLPVYLALVNSLGAQGKLKEAMDIGYSVLSELGEHFPKRIGYFHVFVHLMKIRRMLRGRTGDDILALPLMRNTDKIAAMKLLALLAHHAYFAHRPQHFAPLILRMSRLSLQYGVDRHSPSGFVAYGIILCSLSKWEEGYEFGRVALNLVHRLGAKECEAQVVMVNASFINFWRNPFQDNLEALLKGHQAGIESGDIENSMLCDLAYCTFYFFAGLPLGPLEQDMRGFCALALEYNQVVTYNTELPLRQAVLNLMGRSEDPLQLTGEAMRQEEFIKNCIQHDNMAAIHLVWLLRAQLAYYFGNNELASEQLKLFRNAFNFKSHILFCVSTYIAGLVSLEFARRTRKSKYKHQARKVIETMKKWSTSGAVNFVHWHCY